MQVTTEITVKSMIKFLWIIFLITYVLLDIFFKVKTYIEVNVFQTWYRQAVYELVETLEKNTTCMPLDIKVDNKSLQVVQYSCLSSNTTVKWQ